MDTVEKGQLLKVADGRLANGSDMSYTQLGRSKAADTALWQS